MYDELPQLARDDTLRPAICVYSRVYWILVGWIHADLGVSVRCPSRFLRLCPRLSAIVILDVTRIGIQFCDFYFMGICDSTASGHSEIVVEHADGTKTYPSTWSHYKVLILGTGGSGKSTIFKQCTIIGDGINEDERARWSVRIFCGLLQVARSLVSAGAPHEATEEEVALLMAGGGAAEMAIYEELADWTLCLPLLSCVRTILGGDPIKSCHVLEVGGVYRAARARCTEIGCRST